jgi:hypothetical protein
MTSLSLSVVRHPRALLVKLRQDARTAAAWLSRRRHMLRGEHLLWLILAGVFLLYLLALVFEPSTVGKGGR